MNKLHKAYVQGFCKAASDAGVDPDTLVKIARNDGILDSIAKSYKSLDPNTRRAILGGLITGLGTYTLSNGDTGTRLMKGLAGGAIGGSATYGAGKMGVLDKILPS